MELGTLQQRQQPRNQKQQNRQQQPSHQLNNAQQNGNFQPRRPAGPLTPAQKEFLRKNGGCFYCRKLGHIAPNCRSRPPRTDGQQQSGNGQRRA